MPEQHAASEGRSGGSTPPGAAPDRSDRGGTPIEQLARVRLRAARTERGWSLGQLARLSGVNASTISRIETGQRRLALDHLGPLAGALGLSLDELLADDPLDVVVQPTPSRRDGMVVWHLSRHAGPGGRSVFKLDLPADRTSPELRSHPGHEWLYVLGGVVRLALGEREVRLGPGQTAEFSTLTPHAIASVGGPAELLAIYDDHAERAHLDR